MPLKGLGYMVGTDQREPILPGEILDNIHLRVRECVLRERPHRGCLLPDMIHHCARR